MGYQTLNTELLPIYINGIPILRDFLGRGNLLIQEIGDGNLNLVFVVSSRLEPEKQLIVKQALPYLRCVGENHSLAKERMHYEIAAIKQFTQFTPQHVPMIYHTDLEMCLVVMQYLKNHVIMRKGMIKGLYYHKFADHISTYLAENLFKTSSLYLTSIKKNQLISQFNSNELRQLTENFVFTFPFMQHSSNQIRPSMRKNAENLWADLEFKKQVLILKDLFINKTDALLHGDLHTGSIMLNSEETYVIDPEFAYVGHFGFDIGALLANLVMSWVSHVVRGDKNEYAVWILTVIQDMLLNFEQKFTALWNQYPDSSLLMDNFLSKAELLVYQRQFMQNILQESIGFAGCKMARRQLGIAGVEDIRGIHNEIIVTRAEKLALAIARDFVVNYRHYQKVQDIFIALQRYAATAMNEMASL